MDVNGGYTSSSSYTTTNTNSASTQSDEEMMMMLQQDLRRGPWTVEEDLALINYIANHGEGRWNSLARCAGLKRTGKSCRLRWLNYLRPDVRRGNITLEEQLIILELHSRWGNRWSKIAQHLPGRTDNEIKNYWRTRVQKHAKQLQCDVNSKQFKDTMRYLWMPRLVERIQAAATTKTTTSGTSTTTTDHQYNRHNQDMNQLVLPVASSNKDFNGAKINPSFTRENSSTTASSPVNNTEYYTINNNFPSTQNAHHVAYPDQEYQQTSSSSGYYDQGLGFHQGGFDEQQNMWLGGEDMLENSWNVEDLWFLQQQFNNNGI